MIADVVFDLPLDHPFSYLVPDSLTVAPGQRVSAPLGGRGTRVGVVVALIGLLLTSRIGHAGRLRPARIAADEVAAVAS
jgi:hypothetical protein